MSSGAGRNGAPVVAARYARRNAPDTQRYQASAQGAATGPILGRTTAALEQRRERGVVERPDHAGDVAQAVVLAAPLGQRLGRRPVEVDDHEVLARVEHLFEVVVAVRADAQAGEALVEVRLEHLQHLLLPADQAARVVGDAGREAAEASRAAAAASCRPGCASTGTSSGDRASMYGTGAKLGVVDVRRERQVHLGGAPAEQRREIQIGADDVSRGRGRLGRAASSASARGAASGARVLAVAGQHAFEEAAQLLARVHPGGPLVGDVGLQHRQRARLGAQAAGTRSRRRPPASGPGARAFRKRPSSSSGLSPSSRRRNIFSR